MGGYLEIAFRVQNLGNCRGEKYCCRHGIPQKPFDCNG